MTIKRNDTGYRITWIDTFQGFNAKTFTNKGIAQTFYQHMKQAGMTSVIAYKVTKYVKF